MKHRIVYLIRFIFIRILFCCGDDSSNLDLKPNLKKYLLIRNDIQEDFLDLKSLKPDVLIKLQSDILNEAKKGLNETVEDPFSPARNQLSDNKPNEESNLAKKIILPKNYLPSTQNLRNENEDDGIHKAIHRLKSKPLEVRDTKPKNSNHKEHKNVQKSFSKNFKPILKNYSMDGKGKRNDKPQQNNAQKIFFSTESKENIQPKKMYQSLQKTSENRNQNFKPKLRNLYENVGAKNDKTEDHQKKIGFQNISPKIISSVRPNKMLEPEKTPSTNRDLKEYNKQIQFGEHLQQKKQRTTSGSAEITNSIPFQQDIRTYNQQSGHNKIPFEPVFRTDNLQSGYNPIPNTKSTKGEMTTSDPYLLKKLSDSPNLNSNSYYNSSRNTFIPSAKVKSDNTEKSQISTKTVGDNVEPNYDMKSTRYLSSDYNNGQQKSAKVSDINDLIQVDIYGDLFNKPAYDTVRQKKNIEGRDIRKLSAQPWKTVDMVLAGFAFLTLFVLVTICLALQMNRRRKSPSTGFSDLEESSEGSDGMFVNLQMEDRPKEPNRKRQTKKSYPKIGREHRVSFSTTKKRKRSHTKDTQLKTTDYSNEPPPSGPRKQSTILSKTSNSIKHTPRKEPVHPETVQNSGSSTAFSYIGLPSLPTVHSSSSSSPPSLPTIQSSSSSSPPVDYTIRPSYTRIPSSQLLPSLPTVSSGTSNLSEG